MGLRKQLLQIYLIEFIKCISTYIHANRVLRIGRRRPMLVGDNVDHRPRFHPCATPIDRGLGEVEGE